MLVNDPASGGVTNGATPDLARIERAVAELLAAVGEDPTRDGLLETPARAARMWAEMLAGYRENPAAHLAKTFDIDHGELVLVRDIPFASMCEHHMLPFVGAAHVAYLPGPGGRHHLDRRARPLLFGARALHQRAARIRRLQRARFS